MTSKPPHFSADVLQALGEYQVAVRAKVAAEAEGRRLLRDGGTMEQFGRAERACVVAIARWADARKTLDATLEEA